VRRAIATLAASALLLVPAAPAAAEVTAEFEVGVLTVTGDRADDAIALACVDGAVRVNDAPPEGGRVRCSRVAALLVRAGAGEDRVDLSSARPAGFEALLDVTVYGGAGDDTLIGSPRSDLLVGGSGADEVRGEAGDDSLRGGPGNDQLRGGPGNDQLRGDQGDDACVGGPGADAMLSC
jgi:hypothetical protein